MNARVSFDGFQHPATRVDSTPATPSDNWFAAQLKPNGRLMAERNLRRQGFEVFCPSRTETVRSRNRYQTRVTPLFPGYLFVRFDPARPGWQAINATRGVARLILPPTRAPRPLPKGFVAGLMARCDGQGLLIQSEHIDQGDRIRILSGPFADFVTTVEQLDQNQRLSVLIELMGRETRTTVPRSIVQKIA